MTLRTLKQIKNLKNRKVLVRVGFDCPIKNGKVINDSRIRQVLPTINYLINKKARIILISHLGRPQGKRVKKYSLEPVAKILKKEIKDFRFIRTPIGSNLKEKIDQVKAGKVILLENIRFYPEEEKNDVKFAKRLADLADIYVNEAFSTCHRWHSSINAVAEYLPSYAGFVLEKEVKNLSLFLKKPKHPLVVLMGGKKIETKIKPIKNLLKNADRVLIAGSLASNFLKAAGYEIGKSFFEPEMIKTTRQLLKNKKIVLPFDVKIKEKTQSLMVNVGELAGLGKNFEILDIGPGTAKMFEKYLENAKMIFWNGPMGYFEDERFIQGTTSITRAVLSNRKARIVIGGGDTLAALTQLTNYQVNRLTNIFISSGGGAMLDFFAGKVLPGIKPLIID